MTAFSINAQILMILFLLGSVVCAFFTGACLEYRKQRVVQAYMAIMMFFAGWCLSNFMVIYSSGLESKLFFARLRFVFISPQPPLWVYFCHELFRRPGQKSFGRKFLWLFVLPAAVSFCFAVPSLRHFLIEEAHPFEALGVPTIEWKIGPLVRLHIVVAYILLGWVGIIALNEARTRRGQRTAKFGIVACGLLLLYVIPELVGIHVFPSIRFLGIPLLPQIGSTIGFYYILHRQQAVRSFSQNNDLLFEYLPTPALLVDAKEKIFNFNSRAAELFSLTIASAGQMLNEALPANVMENLPALEKVPSGLIVETDAGRFFEVICEPFRHSILSGEGHLLIFNEVTELKKTTQANQHLLSLMSHDLLGNLSSLSHLISARSERHWDLMSDAARSSVDLIKNVLLWSASNGDMYKVSKEPVAVHEMIRMALEQTRAIFAEKNIIIEGTALRDSSVVYVDIKMFQAILRNLLSNAAKFSPRNASIRIDCRIHAGSVHLSVEDRGPGMGADTITNILDQNGRRFTRGANSEGYGIGLFLVVQFLRLHGGRLDIHSPSSSGCRVTAIWPHDPACATLST